MFEAVKQKAGNSSLSLDDLRLVPRACPALGACAFNSDSCGYSIQARDPLLWLIGNGKTHNPNVTVGPPEDASDSSGMYAYIDFTKQGLNKGDNGRMISGTLPPSDIRPQAGRLSRSF